MKLTETTIKNMRSRKDIPDGWIYIGDDDERYVLGLPGTYNLLIFGVNPSTATPEKDDATIRKVRKIVEASGYDGWIMVNLYPQIATDPDALHDTPDKKLSSNNIKILKAISQQYKIGAALAAWGNLINKRFFLGEELIKILDVLEGDFEWYHLGKSTKSGNPRHPLYLKADEKFEYFSVRDYVTAWMNI